VSVAVHEDGGLKRVVMGPLFCAWSWFGSEMCVVTTCISLSDILVFQMQRRGKWSTQEGDSLR
jgi:hypothetical protein